MAKLVAMVSIYRSGDWIENRLKNLLQSQIIDDTEIWCVNANSPDERDHEIPLKYAEKHKQIKYEKLNKRLTVYQTWNYIIHKTDSRFITNANTDDIVSPTCYSKLCKVLEQYGSRYAVAYCSWYTTGLENQDWHSITRASSDGKPGNFNGNIDTSGVGHFPLWRRSIHNEIGYFDDTFQALADADWWTRIHYCSDKKFVWVNELLALYLWKSGQNLWHTKITGEEWNKFHSKVSQYKNKVFDMHNNIEQIRKELCQ